MKQRLSGSKIDEMKKYIMNNIGISDIDPQEELALKIIGLATQEAKTSYRGIDMVWDNTDEGLDINDISRYILEHIDIKILLDAYFRLLFRSHQNKAFNVASVLKLREMEDFLGVAADPSGLLLDVVKDYIVACHKFFTLHERHTSFDSVSETYGFIEDFYEAHENILKEIILALENQYRDIFSRIVMYKGKKVRPPVRPGASAVLFKICDREKINNTQNGGFAGHR